MRNIRLQSAMEYLMTYGWAIFIIAVVMGSLAYLFFSGNASNLISPKASPGNCFVQLSYQSSNLGLSRANRNLEGQCNNEEPQYVAKFNPVTNAFIEVKHIILIKNTGTVSFWANPSNIQTTGESVIISFAGGSNIGLSNGYFEIGGSGYTGEPYYNKWDFVTFTFNGIENNEYINGQNVYSGLGGFSTNSIMYIGDINGAGNPFNGTISNLQLYNVSLSQSDIMQLYDEGIGGAPIALQNLAGWWPLNGNANDYSGVNNNGNAINVEYTTSWSSGYTQPQNFTT